MVSWAERKLATFICKVSVELAGLYRRKLEAEKIIYAEAKVAGHPGIVQSVIIFD